MDELTSDSAHDASNSTSSNSEEQSTSTSAREAAEPQQSGQQAQRVNLFESPEFRNYQAQMTRQMQEAQRVAQQAQQELHAARMAQMDDLEKANYTASEYQRAYNDLMQQQERQQLEWQRWQTLQELSTRTGVSVETLSQAQTPKEAYELAIEEMRKVHDSVVNTRAAELAIRKEANKPDIGGGTVGSASADEMTRAIAGKDSATYYRLLLQQGR